MTGNVSSAQLRAIVERIERLEEDKKAIADDIREVKAEAKANGFSVATINSIIRLRRMDPDERAEHEALLDIYKAALGMLDGTPLGEAARRRMTGDGPPADAPDNSIPPEPPVDQAAIDRAREAGRNAARDGGKILDNPFVAGDPRRAAWDEGYCEAAGSDGMDIPDAWRPKKRTQKDGAKKTENRPAEPNGKDSRQTDIEDFTKPEEPAAPDQSKDGGAPDADIPDFLKRDRKPEGEDDAS